MIVLALCGTTRLARSSEPERDAKVCIAHAGASAYAPGHTLSAYRLAIEMGTDYIEQDLQLTKDGVLICIHDATLERTTNVEDVFPDRSRMIEKGGKTKKTWPVIDFTLNEVKQLDMGSWFDLKFKDERVVTFQESIDVARGKCGICPEMKKSDFIADGGTDVVAEVHRVLVANGLDRAREQRDTPVLIQCFHPPMLKHIRQLSGGAYPLMQLVWLTQVNELLTDDGLAEVAIYADSIGPTLSTLLDDRTRIDRAKEKGLLVHPWIPKKDIPKGFPAMKGYYEFLLFDLHVDGLFTDHPDRFPRR